MFRFSLCIFVVLFLHSFCLASGGYLNFYTRIDSDLSKQLTSYVMYDKEFAKYFSSGKKVPPDELIGAVQRALKRTGYDYDKTIIVNLKGKSYADVDIANKNGYDGLLLPVFSALQEGYWQKTVEKGYMSNDAFEVIANIYDNTQEIHGGKKINRPIIKDNNNIQSVNKLTEKEYKDYLANSEEFRNADMELSEAWKNANIGLDEEGKSNLLKAQRDWLKNGRHEDAASFMNNGLDKLHAYIKSIHKRANVLRVIEHNNNLSKEDVEAGLARPDDYYNAIDDDKNAQEDSTLPDNCGIVQYALPVVNNLYSIVLDDGAGKKNTFYYYFQKDSESVNCGDVKGAMCFNILQEVPVTPKLKESGVSGNTMKIIHQCRAAN